MMYSYEAADAVGKGVQAASLQLQWNRIESSPGVFMGPDATAWMTALSTYPSYNLELTLSIATLNTCQHMVASDLAATHWNDPALMLRFQYLLNWLWLTA